jgi:hypothetical protein
MSTDDYIKRSDLVAHFSNFDPGLGLIDQREVLDDIQDFPAADVEPVRHGHNVKWDYPTLFECSLCGWECFDTVPGDTDTYQYCPNCGAKMQGEKDGTE